MTTLHTVRHPYEARPQVPFIAGNRTLTAAFFTELLVKHGSLYRRRDGSTVLGLTLGDVHRYMKDAGWRNYSRINLYDIRQLGGFAEAEGQGLRWSRKGQTFGGSFALLLTF